MNELKQVIEVESQPNISELITNVEQWSSDKELHKADPSRQFLKVSEEVGEVAAGMARDDAEMIKDGIGDVVVTLIILAQQHNMTLAECLDTAYSEIRDRKGKMVNGTFIKDSDLINGVGESDGFITPDEFYKP